MFWQSWKRNLTIKTYWSAEKQIQYLLDKKTEVNCINLTLDINWLLFVNTGFQTIIYNQITCNMFDKKTLLWNKGCSGFTEEIEIMNRKFKQQVNNSTNIGKIRKYFNEVCKQSMHLYIIFQDFLIEFWLLILPLCLTFSNDSHVGWS